MIIDCIADLHGHFPELEGGDLLIVAGDLTAMHTVYEFQKFKVWLSKQKYEKTIVIAGNHDDFFEKRLCVSSSENWDSETTCYLEDSGTTFRGLKIWGSPWSPWFPKVNPKCTAFMKEDKLLSEYWKKIPTDTDILITHAPAFGTLDGVPMRDCDDGTLYHCGSKSLQEHFEKVHNPVIHIFGHIHHSYGEADVHYKPFPLHAINCSHVNEKYKPVNKPIRIELL